jgi:hypothetical protein
MRDSENLVSLSIGPKRGMSNRRGIQDEKMRTIIACAIGPIGSDPVRRAVEWRVFDTWTAQVRLASANEQNVTARGVSLQHAEA